MDEARAKSDPEASNAADGWNAADVSEVGISEVDASDEVEFADKGVVDGSGVDKTVLRSAELFWEKAGFIFCVKSGLVAIEGRASDRCLQGV